MVNSQEIKEQVIELIRKDLGKVDFVVYSIAAPRRTAPDGKTYTSVLKPIGKPYSDKTIDLKNRAVVPVTAQPAEQQEIEDTVKVMGGEDWMLWMDALAQADVLEENVKTVAYSYIGPEATYPLYRLGTIGKAKEDLEASAKKITEALASKHGSAFVSVNKALVTQASAAIPVVPLYITLLFKLMKELGLHEDCIAQMDRLFREKLFIASPILDEEGRLRVDDWELNPEVQNEIKKRWPAVCSENLEELADIQGYWKDFYNLFGFEVDGVDYSQDISPLVPISSVS